MRRKSQADRLSDRIKATRAEARRLPAGPEYDVLLRSVEHDEIALRIIQWLTSPGHLPAIGYDPYKASPIAAKVA